MQHLFSQLRCKELSTLSHESLNIPHVHAIELKEVGLVYGYSDLFCLFQPLKEYQLIIKTSFKVYMSPYAHMLCYSINRFEHRNKQ